MNYSRLIHDYLDGELPKQKEEFLFNEIATNSSIRTDFNLQMKIHLVAKQDLGVIATPLSITNAVFSQLGFAPPTVISEPSFGSKLYDFTKKNAVWLLLLLFVSTVATSGYLIFKNNQLANELNSKKNSSIPYVYSEDGDHKDNAKSTNASDNLNYFDNSKEQIANAENILNNDNGLNKAFQSLQSNNNLKRKNVINADDNKTNSLTFTEESANESNYGNGLNNSLNFNTLTDAEIRINSLKHNSNRELNKRNYSKNENGIIIPNFYESLMSLFNYSELDNTDFSFRIRNLQGLYNSNEFTNLNNNVPFYNDMAVGVWYKISSNHYLGIETGVEKFTQKFKLGSGLEYQQNPDMLWAGISYKFTMKDFLIPYILYPYTELTAGATSIGPIFRAQSGLNYSISNRIGLNLGFEYNTLYYNVEGTIYNSNKLGFTGGININF